MPLTQFLCSIFCQIKIKFGKLFCKIRPQEQHVVEWFLANVSYSTWQSSRNNQKMISVKLHHARFNLIWLYCVSSPLKNLFWSQFSWNKVVALLKYQITRNANIKSRRKQRQKENFCNREWQICVVCQCLLYEEKKPSPECFPIGN